MNTKKYQYNYSEIIAGEVHQHLRISDNKTELLTMVKEHWKDNKFTPLNLFCGSICQIDKQGFEDIKKVKEELDEQKDTMG
jgi:hypothetical protein